MPLLGEVPLRIRTFAAAGEVGRAGTYTAGTRAVWSVSIDTATDGEDYGIDLYLASAVSVSVSVTAGIGDTATDIAQDLETAWNATVADDSVSVEASGDTLTFTEAASGSTADVVLDENAAKMTRTVETVGVEPYTDTDTTGTFRPAPSKVVQQLPEGDRRRDPRVVHLTSRLELGDNQDDDRPPSWVSDDAGDHWYELQDEFDGDTPLPGSGVAHWRYLALRLQEDG